MIREWIPIPMRVSSQNKSHNKQNNLQDKTLQAIHQAQ